MTEVIEFLQENSVGGLLATVAQQTAAEYFCLNHAAVEECALIAGLLPARYQRNHSSITVEQQLKLLRSCVAVIGCGGLGGYIVEELARLGVGEIVIIDHDCFEDHNLNRQLFSSPFVLGQPKVRVAAKRVAEINPAVRVRPRQCRFGAERATELLADVDVVADAVDSVKVRLELESSCRSMELPLVHGAIAGWYGHICTVLPGDNSLEKIYRHWNHGAGIEQDLGNPAFTPAVIAGLQVAEICKVLLGKQGLLRNRKLTIDLLDMEIEEIPL